MLAQSVETKYSWKSIFHQLNNDFKTREDSCLLVSLFGEFNYDFVNSLSEKIEQEMGKEKSLRKVARKIFSIAIEGLQMICFSSADIIDKKQLGHLVIAKKSNSVHISIGNVISSHSVHPIIRCIEEINSLSYSNLQNLYYNNLCRNLVNEKKSLEFSFIVMALKSKSKINYQLLKQDEKHTYLDVQVTLDLK